ncbi:hypothetical protein BDA96_03G214400 [Sorghum bicolor]|uniref:Uncharacterized protein n=2 Tax=Sorghum bicolor TaxID=4558 RepID=A0A921UQN7_SORBI|nr:hypothetical protein BDA96_03G214400 [Sorghum bicolor]KXG32780.1 hypothetical protein SORBI_3003G198100 [Sorghum bicolor]
MGLLLSFIESIDISFLFKQNIKISESRVSIILSCDNMDLLLLWYTIFYPNYMCISYYYALSSEVLFSEITLETLILVQGQNYIVLICTLKYKTRNIVRLGPFLVAQKDRNMYQLFLQKNLAGRSHLSYFHVVWDENKITIH